MNTAALKKEYKEQIAPTLQKQFNYTSAMQIPVLKKIVINQGLGDATQDKKIIEVAINEITAITGQKAVATYSKKDIAKIIFPEINIGQVDRIQGLNITFVTSAQTDEEGYALLKAFGLPFKNAKND